MAVKKWHIVAISALLGLGVALAAPPAVHPVTGEPLVITCLRGTPEAIDGDLGDWNLEALPSAVLDASAQLYTGQASWTGPEDCSGTFYVMWDDQKFYFAAVVKDDVLSMNKTNGDIWNADCVEFFISTTNALAGHTEHYQWGINANGQKWNWESMDGGAGVVPANLELASVRTPDGYICEAALDYSSIQALQIVAGNTIGFHPCIDDTDAADREIQMTWTSREAHDQSLGFGHLTFSDQPAIAKELSRGPKPTNGAVDVPVDAALSWTAGQFAASHDVYFGTSLDGVNEASRTNSMDVLVSQGQAGVDYDPDGMLEFGQTYYWRVDEVNGAPDNTIFKGETWSFTTEPYAYPLTGVTATASSSQPGMGPNNVVNGSGLNADDQHSTESTDMWVSAGSNPDWIQFEFDKAYKLGELWVWNSNQLIEAFVGFGAKDVAIEYSLDGAAWTALEGVPEFARATGAPTYTADTVVDLGGVTAQFVKLTINSNWGGVTPRTSLSEVRFFYVPVQAFAQQPADGAAEVALDATLTWRSGREASSHEVFFGTDGDAVAAGAVAGRTVTDGSFTPAAMEFGTTYYWKVNEVGDTGTYEGDLWSFASQEFAVVEDFEAYNDDVDAQTTIWHAWIDGLTTGASGSQVGYDVAPFAEKVLIHGGKQSMPLLYDNTAAPFYSEAELEFDAQQNWTGSGAAELSIWTRGYPAPTAVAVTETGGKMSLSGSGADIWGNSDQFTYAFKTLAGDGSIVARVASIGPGSNTWAKGGVMIRDSLGGGSTHAMMVLTANTDGAAGNGASFQYRATTAGTSSNVDSGAVIKAPYWVKIERVGDTLTGSLSANGTTWTQMGQTIITMDAPVYIGLAVTSHAAGESRTFQFENIATTGNVTGAWQGAVVDSAQYNAAADMYLAVEDSTGKTAMATIAGAANVADWTQWVVPMSDLAGVNFARITKLTIGVGNKAAPAAGGTGIVFIDDIGYGRSAQ